MRTLLIVSLAAFGCVEAEDNNPFGEGLLQGEPAFTNAGASWPVAADDEWLQPEPQRVFYVAPTGDDSAFGGQDAPWATLQQSLCKLRPGDRLVVRSGNYAGPIRVDGDCANVPAGQFIDVVGEPGAKLVGVVAESGEGFWNPVLVVNRAGWTLRGFQIDATTGAGVGVQVLSLGARTTLRDLVIFGASKAGMTVGPLAADVSAYNLVLRNGASPDGDVTHGVLVLGGSDRFSLAGSFVRNNTGDGVHVLGPHVLPTELAFTENVTKTAGLRLEGNRIHDNRGHAVVVGASREVSVVANIIWNVRPSAASVGAAVEVHDGAEAALIERNLIAEATEGVRVAAGARLEALGDEGRPPQGVLVERNVIYNRINPSRFGVVIDHAVGVRLYHNLVYHSRKALMVSDLPPKTQAIRALNNLFLEASELGFRTSGMSVFDRFEANVFGWGLGAVTSEVGDERRSIAEQVADETLEGIVAVSAVTFTDNDLSRPVGVEVVDQGAAIPGLAYEGAAPDLGPVERATAQ